MKEFSKEEGARLIVSAASFALEAHGSDCRKDGYTPAFLHAAEAASVASTVTTDPEVVAAAFLHDVIEDTDTPEETIKKRFGDRVYNLVKSETEENYPDLTKAESWKIRKQASLDGLAKASDEGTKVIWLSDKLSNIRAYHRDEKIYGAGFWDRFNQKDPLEHEWYFREILRLLKPLEDTQAYKEFEWLINDTFSEYRKER